MLIEWVPRMIFGLAEGDDPETPKTKQADEEPKIPESEWKRMLEEERKRIREETRQAVMKELEGKMLPDELSRMLEELDLSSPDDLVTLLREVIEGVEDDEGADDDVVDEKIKAMEARFQKELEQRERELQERAKREAELSKLLEAERIDNSLKYELEKRHARTPELIVLALRRYVRLDENMNPVVVNEQGEPRVKTIEYVEDGVRKFKTVDMTISDLVDEFLSREENQHFLPASSREGSGATSTQPLRGKAALEAEYQRALEEARKQGKITPEFIRMWQKRYAESAS